MRIIYRSSVVLLAAFVLLFSFGCDPDTGGTGGGGGVVLNPTIQLNTGDGLVAFNQDLPLATESFIVSITGNDGDNPLRSLTISENGVNIPTDRLVFRTGQTSNNPILLTGTDAEGFTYEVEIFPGVTTSGSATYDFLLTDTDNLFANTSVTINYTSVPPRAELLIADGTVSGDVTITSASTAFDVRVGLSSGDDSVRTFTILEDGNVLDASQITYVSPSFSAMNPLTLLPEEQESVTFDIRISPVGAENTTRVYTFRATDAAGVLGETSVTITFDTPMTDLTRDTTGVFFNASGGMDGGLDLDNATAVGFNSPDAELQDEGIDLNAAGENWRTQVSSVNDAVLKIADLSVLGDGVTFDDVLLSAQIAQVFDAETSTIPDGNDNFPDADGDTSASEDVTQPLVEGDVLVVRRGDRSYLVRIDEINFVAGSNNDSYSVSIKY